MITGSKTYPSILSQNKDFVKKLNEFQPSVKIMYQDKKHIPMMSQFIFSWNDNYKNIIDFIELNK